MAPYDPLIWKRSGSERLFGFRYRIGIHTPAANRAYGYYVLTLLLGDRFVARVDLKSDRQTSRLVVGQVTLEDRAPADASARVDKELIRTAGWLGLERLKSTPTETICPRRVCRTAASSGRHWRRLGPKGSYSLLFTIGCAVYEWAPAPTLILSRWYCAKRLGRPYRHVAGP